MVPAQSRINNSEYGSSWFLISSSTWRYEWRLSQAADIGGIYFANIADAEAVALATLCR